MKLAYLPLWLDGSRRHDYETTQLTAWASSTHASCFCVEFCNLASDPEKNLADRGPFRDMSGTMTVSLSCILVRYTGITVIMRRISSDLLATAALRSPQSLSSAPTYRPHLKSSITLRPFVLTSHSQQHAATTFRAFPHSVIHHSSFKIRGFWAESSK